MSHNKYVKVPVKGMHCRSCEILIEEKLKEVKNVSSVNVNYKTGEAIVHYQKNIPDDQLIEKMVNEAGYEIGIDEKSTLLSRDKKEYADLGIAFLFLMAVYLVIKDIGLLGFNLIPDLSHPSWPLIVVIGLVAGVSSCMALVGGLSLGLSAKFAENHPTATPMEKFRPHIFFILGRILGYAILGGVLGLLGTAVKLSALSNGILTLLVGLVMLVMGLQLINIFPRLSKFKFTLPKGVSKALGLSGRHKEYSHKNAMIMGGLTFFLPCGFTQAMQLYAISTGNIWFGALIMGLFALGTAPGLLSVGGLTSFAKGSFKERFFKGAGIAVIFFALFNFNNGYTLVSLNVGSLGFGSSQAFAAVDDPNVVLENGVQIIHMTEENDGYSPNTFSIKKGVPVKWIIDAQAPYSCASSIMIPKLNIQKTLKAGENIIEFTPKSSGKLPFSCSMGMYTGAFNVYDDNTSASALEKQIASTPAPAASNSGTCGSGGGGCGCGGGGGGQQADTNAVPVAVKTTNDSASKEAVQIIKTTYTASKYLSPSAFKVKAGTKVRLEIDVRDNGSGCGYDMTIPGLYSRSEPLKAGVPISMEFTPQTPGSYNITCGMNMIRFGSIIVE
ncbi:MAG TPA: sulfite exporter TauE/SafE family protein [Candidatus Saccharimonadales bacterium]|nr:sulfite exporter TauE/SafE family protein [Candidatus Saccharimonadales bacterium]